MRKLIYFAAALLFVGCNESIKENFESKANEVIHEIHENEGEEPARVKRDSLHSEVKTEATIQTETYSGAWFQIDYPSSFTASPTKPTKTFGDYTFVDTDEARFTSPDGAVEFFVFSPQWSGDPLDYLVQQPNEKTVEQSEDKANSDDPFAVSHHWVTYADKNGKYTRSYHSLITENTHHVFGVKYTTRKMYERYKAAYLAFKKSLKQFAD